MVRQIYILCYQNKMGDCHGFAVAEDGAGLAESKADNEQALKLNLGIGTDKFHDIYDRHYPAGFELVFVQKPEKDKTWLRSLMSICFFL